MSAFEENVSGNIAVREVRAPLRWPPHPYIYEIDTWPWLAQIGRAEGRQVDLGTVPDRCWDAIAERGFDAVWLMGVWQRSPAGVELALANPALMESFTAALPDLRREDVVGSPYCIRNYVVDGHLGGRAGLEAARSALSARGMNLVLDFVPNHVAPDHPWTATRPERFVQGTFDDLREHPESFVEVAGRVLANGRDPFFPAWPDIVQLNAFSHDLRGATVELLRTIAELCDGVRCDMAMLMMNDTFERTWGDRAGPRPRDEYWPTVMAGVRAEHPDFQFIGEAYWDLEWALQQQGFDYCYDKRLYDRLLHEDPESVRLHLCADDEFQSKLVRFVENHDEPRMASLVDDARHAAMAVTTFTQNGARLYHDGQDEGRRVRLPVFLGRYPDEPRDDALVGWYRRLWDALADPVFRTGRWQLCERSGWDGNDRYTNLVAWCWDGAHRYVVVVNLSDEPAAAHVRVPWDDVRGATLRLHDASDGNEYERTGDALRDGMYVQLDGWGWHLFRVEHARDADGRVGTANEREGT